MPELSEQSLGIGYVVSAGVALSLALLAHAVASTTAGPTALLIVCAGVVPASALAAANYWLPRSGLQGTQIWTVAEWSGLGIGVFTLVNLAVVASGVPITATRMGLLASSVAMAGCLGVLIGTLLELNRTTRRLSQSNDVLNRVLRHDMRNNLNVVLGHVSELDRVGSEDVAPHVEQLQQSVDQMITTTEKARQIDVALAADRRAQRPVDLVSYVLDRTEAVGRAYPDATVETDVPEEAMVHADWLLGTVLDNVIENAIVHSDDTPSLYVTVDVDGDTTEVRLTDDCPTIPDSELDVFSAGVETPLQHSKGVGLWLVTWVVESYGGEVRFGTTEDGGNVVTLQLRTATWLSERRHSLPMQ